MKTAEVLKPCWPDGLETNTPYRVYCDDKGRNKGTFLQVVIAMDGDAHVSTQEWEDIPDG